jgi:F-type H+-transporting ATPase subunit b
MPQFNPANFPSQIFWLVVAFVALYLVVSRLAIPRIAAVLDQRARLVQDDLDRAAALKAETDKAIAAYEQAMAEARAQAQDHVRRVTTEMKAIADARNAEIGAEVTRQIADAEARIGKARAEALDGLKVLAGDTARAVVAKLAAMTPDASAVDAAVTAALKEVR